MRNVPFWPNKQHLLREAAIAWLILFVSVPLSATLSVLLTWFGVSEGYSIGVPFLLVGTTAAISLVVLINRADRGVRSVKESKTGLNGLARQLSQENRALHTSVAAVAGGTYVPAPSNLRPNPGYAIHVMEVGTGSFSTVKAETLAIPVYCESTTKNMGPFSLAGLRGPILDMA